MSGMVGTARSRVIRVVVADDHADFRRALCDALDIEPDISVIGEAGDAVEAMELARTQRPDVVVMDVAMPGPTGVEATRSITAATPGIRVVAISVRSDQPTRAAMLAAGAVSFVDKHDAGRDVPAAIRAAAS